MNLYDLTIISVALALDAFGVSISIGINSRLKFRDKLIYALYFGFFQFFFALSGSYAGFIFNIYVVNVPKIIGGIIIVVVGILMLKEGHNGNTSELLKNQKTYLVLGMSVSIDALVIGFTVLNKITSNTASFKNCIYIGFVTLILSVCALVIGRYLKKIDVVRAYADYIGGFILILFGLKMIIF